MGGVDISLTKVKEKSLVLHRINEFHLSATYSLCSRYSYGIGQTKEHEKLAKEILVSEGVRERKYKKKVRNAWTHH